MKRSLSIDVLRGVAVLLVLIRHCDAAWGTALEPIRRGGWVGVDLFFVLSGFLVSGLLFNEFEKTGEIKPARFLIRRGWKIYPAFWVFLAFTVGLAVMLGTFSWSKTLTELSFTQSYVVDRWWGHTWSLAVEEHFYVLLPFLLVPLAKDKFQALPRIVFAIVAVLAFAKCLSLCRPFSEQTHLFPTHLRLDGMFFGVLLAYWHRTWPEFVTYCKTHSLLLIEVGVAMLLPAFLYDVESTPYLYSIGLTVQMLGSGAILMGLVCGGVPENLVTKALGYVGYYSYSIYLWHMVVIMLLAPTLGINAIWFAVLGSIALGVVLSRLIEVPALRLRDAFA